jgi:hypothetical protein
MKPSLTLCLAACAAFLVIAASGSQAQTIRYTASADGQEVTDSQTNLIWRRCAEGMNWDGSTCSGAATPFTHEAALQRAAAQAASTGKAWRLPNIKELSSIADKSRSNPAIDPTAFPATPSSWFWSASPNVGNSNGAWFVSFDNGLVGDGYRDVTGYVRLVRAGQ